MAITSLNHDKHKIYCPFIYPHILKGHLGSFSGEECNPLKVQTVKHHALWKQGGIINVTLTGPPQLQHVHQKLQYLERLSYNTMTLWIIFSSLRNHIFPSYGYFIAQ